MPSALVVAVAPNIPTLAGGGLAGFDLVSWQGVVAPAGLPRPIVDRLAVQIEEFVVDPGTRERLAAVALEPLPGSTPDGFAAYIKAEVDRRVAAARKAGVRWD